MKESLPDLVAAIPKRKHGCFNDIAQDMISGETDPEAVCAKVRNDVH